MRLLRIVFSFLSVVFIGFGSLSMVCADTTAGVFEDSGVSGSNIKNGEIGFDDIPKMINGATTFLLGFSATASVLAIIYGALQLSIFSGVLGGNSDGKEKAKKAIQYGITGFLTSASAWLIIQMIITNL